MGSDHSDAGETFRREDWQEVERSEQATTWQNRRDPTQRIEEYRLHLASEEDCRREREVYYLRKNHPQLVAALYLCSESSNDFCSSSYQQRLFLEKTPIRLSDIQHIPYPDFLHLYSQALRGFAELAQHFGPFPVEEEYIGVNEKGVAKVWMNPDFSSHHAIGGKVSQEDMVRNIVDIIERNLDQSQMPQRVPSVRTYLYRNSSKLQFQDALTQFNNFIREFGNGYVPQKLECIDRVGGIYAIANRDKSLQLTQTPLQYATSSPLPSSIQQAVVNDQNRPRLVQSGIISNQFQQAPSFAAFYPPSSVIVVQSPLQNGSVLTPSTVRQNVPVVRKQAATFYNFTNNQPQQPPIQPEQIRFEPARTAPVFALPPPVKQVYIPEQASSKVGSRASQPKTGQNSSNPPVPNGLANSNSPLYVNTSNEIANRLINGVTNEGSPTIRPPSEPAYFNPQFFQQLNTQSNVNPPPISTNNNNNFAFTPQVNSTVSVNNTENNSQIASNSTVQQSKPASSNDYAFNALEAIRNETAPTVFMPQEYVPPNFNWPSQPSQEVVQAQQEPTPSYSNFSKTNQAKYSTVDVDDGKSSLDFLQKLKGFSNFSSPFLSQQQEAPQSFGTIEPSKQEYQNPFYTDSSQPVYKYDARQYNDSNAASSRAEEEQFGRNAVSNIVHQTGYEVGADRISEPLKFQNSNMDMKYSIFQQSGPSAHASYAYRSYEASFDPELLADLNRQRQ